MYQAASTAILQAGLTNALEAALLALAVWGLTRWWRHAQVAHSLWLLVLVKLLAPTFWTVTIPVDSLSFARPQVTAEVPPELVTLGSDAVADDFSIDVAVHDVVEHGRMADDVPLVSPSDALVVAEWDDGRIGEEDVAASDTASDTSDSPGAAPAVTYGWPVLLLLVWGTGSVVWITMATYRIRSFCRLLGDTHGASQALERQARRFASALGLSRCPEIRITPGRISPMVWAAGARPLILLPADLLEQLDDREQASLLAHELAHVYRHDHWIRWLEFLVLAVYWWNPVAWWVRRKLQEAEEECCDAWAVSLMGDGSKEYAQALWKTIHWLTRRGEPLPQLASGMGRASSITRRFQMIIGRNMQTRMTWRMRVGLALAALVILPLSARVAVRAQESAESAVEVEPAESAEAAAAAEAEAAESDEADERAEADDTPGRPRRDRERRVEIEVRRDQRTDSASPEGRLEQRLGRLERMVRELAEAVRRDRPFGDRPFGDRRPALVEEDIVVRPERSEEDEEAGDRPRRRDVEDSEDAGDRPVRRGWFPDPLFRPGEEEEDVLMRFPLRAVRRAREQQREAVTAAQRAATRAAELAGQDRDVHMRHLQQQKARLENELQMKELEIRRIHLELEFLQKQLQQVASQLEEAQQAR